LSTSAADTVTRHLPPPRLRVPIADRQDCHQQQRRHGHRRLLPCVLRLLRLEPLPAPRRDCRVPAEGPAVLRHDGHRAGHPHHAGRPARRVRACTRHCIFSQRTRTQRTDM
jgi:hypothetical protein